MAIICQNCGYEYNVKFNSNNAPDTKAVTFSFYQDESGLNHFGLYCRGCEHITDWATKMSFGMLIGKPKFEYFQCLDTTKMSGQERSQLTINAETDIKGRFFEWGFYPDD